jgi:hypothetical protein
MPKLGLAYELPALAARQVRQALPIWRISCGFISYSEDRTSNSFDYVIFIVKWTQAGSLLGIPAKGRLGKT